MSSSKSRSDLLTQQSNPVLSKYNPTSFPSQVLALSDDDELTEEDEPFQPPPPPRRKHHSPSAHPPSASTSFRPVDIVPGGSSHAKTHPRTGHAKSSIIDNDATDEDDDLSIIYAPSASSSVAKTAAEIIAQGQIEDVCLVCPGTCHCGGGVSTGRSLKIKLTLSNPIAGSSSSTGLPPLPIKAYSRTRSPSTSLPPPHKKHKSSNDSANSKKLTDKKMTRKKSSLSSSLDPSFSTSSHRKKVVATSPTTIRRSDRPIPTPARSSLRQVIAASVRDFSESESRGNSPAISRRTSFASGSGSDLTEQEDENPDSEGEDQIEKAEEKALIEEFERGSTGTEARDESSTSEEEIFSDSSEVDFETGWEERARERAEDRLRTNPFFRDDTGDGFSSSGFQSHGPGSRPRDHSIGAASVDLDLDVEELDLSLLPPTGGRGVVTWSDYDSVEDSEIDEDAGEFEDELGQLLALSEAVVGPVQPEYMMGEMWFEELSNQGDDESGSAVGDSDDDGDKTLTLVDGFHLAVGDSSEDSSDEDDDDEDDSDGYQYGNDFDGDDGDTTDSLDSDDHVGLVRFGIEVDTDSSDDSASDETAHLSRRLPPGTASLADVQAPTCADLAALPGTRYLLSSNMGQDDGVEMMIDLHDLDASPERAILQAAAGLGVGKATAARILEGVDRAWLQQGYPQSATKRSATATRKRPHADEDSASSTAGGPAMGSFVPKVKVKGKGKGKAIELSHVIDGSDTMAPSPFAKLKGKKRASQLLDGTPSRRARADSKVSTASGHSLTDGSVSGELPEIASPYVSPKAIDFDDVLHASILQQDDDPDDADSSDARGRVIKPTRGSRAPPASTPASLNNNLSRWKKVGISAFRSSTMPSFSPTSHYNSATGDSALRDDHNSMLYAVPRSNKTRRHERNGRSSTTVPSSATRSASSTLSVPATAARPTGSRSSPSSVGISRLTTQSSRNRGTAGTESSSPSAGSLSYLNAHQNEFSAELLRSPLFRSTTTSTS